MARLQHVPEPYREIASLCEEQSEGSGTPSNPPEARLQRLLLDHHFPPGDCRKRVTTTIGLPTEPDWLYEPSKVAIYLDGMSRSLHGDPKTAQRDLLIRQSLELDGYRVIVVQSRDLNDPQAVRQHVKNIAEAIGRPELGDFDQVLVQAHQAPNEGQMGLSELLSLCDKRCRGLLEAIAKAEKDLPIVGYELRDESGRVTPHQAELAWESVGIAVVLPEVPQTVEAFRAEGWAVFLADDPRKDELILDRLGGEPC